MTPEEKAVVQAAIAANPIGRPPTTAQLNVLRDATHRLILTCSQCNTASHACPGCGADVQHGDVACPICTDTPRDPAMLEPVTDVDQEAGELWVQRTFADVRAGDRIRLGSAPGAPEARITARYLHPSDDPAGRTWHVVPSGETGPWAHKGDVVVQPGEVVLCSPDINAGEPYRFKPEVPVEIWFPDRATLRAVEAWGWSKRLDYADVPDPRDVH